MASLEVVDVVVDRHQELIWTILLLLCLACAALHLPEVLRGPQRGTARAEAEGGAAPAEPTPRPPASGEDCDAP